MSADAVLIWSVLWAGRMAGNKEIYKHYREMGKPIIVADVGSLQRGHTWKIALDHINGLGYYGHQQDLDPDRPKKLGLKLEEAKNHRSEILIASQHRQSLQTENVNLERWISSTCDKIRLHSDRLIVLRPHPRSNLDRRLLPSGIVLENPQKISGSYDSFDFDPRYHAVINYNSGPGILAAIAGARTIVDDSSLARPVSISIPKIEEPYTVDRHRWFLEITHTEYTVDEIRQGLWLKRLNTRLRILE